MRGTQKQKQPRSAATLVPSPGKKLRDLDKRALDLERQLTEIEATASALTNASQRELEHEKANRVRVPLCEVLADLLLLDAQYALRNNVLERLWRRCFYQRISRLRVRIAKELKKKKTTNAAGGGGGGNTASTSNSLIIVGQLEKHLFGFLVESITLYDFLCGKLTEQLAKAKGVATTNTAGSSTVGDSTTITVASASSTSVPNSTAVTNTACIVECISRLNICRGDLFRYCCGSGVGGSGSSTTISQTTQHYNLSKAQACYETSARLGPGYGHSYNQLGVLCQGGGGVDVPSNNSSNSIPVALTLYWYARALLSSHIASVTTKTNVSRLLRLNQQWLQQQLDNDQATSTSGEGTSGAAGEEEQQQPHAHHHQQQQIVVVSNSSNNNNKSMQTRRFLAMFVDLHAHFFTGMIEEPADWKHRLDTLSEAFTALLQSSALGDALLCKLVAIQAFSECFGEREILNNSSTTEGEGDANAAAVVVVDKDRVARVTWTLARHSTLTLAAAMADRVLVGLHKLCENGSVGGKSQLKKGVSAAAAQAAASPPSVRLLLPLLLVTEYLHAHAPGKNGLEHDEGSSPAGREESLLEDHPSPHYRTTTGQRHAADCGGFDAAHERFWFKIVQVLNLLVKLVTMLDNTNSSNNVGAAVTDLDQLKEYRALRGYTPFQSFIRNDLKDGFVSDDDALEILLPQHGGGGGYSQESSSIRGGSTQESIASIGSSSISSNPEQGRIKVARFLKLGEELAADTTSELGKRIGRDSNDHGRYVWIPQEQNIDDQEEDEDDNNGFAMDVDDDDEAGDAVVMLQEDENINANQTATSKRGNDGCLIYKQDASVGVPLLVPSALLQDLQQQPQQPVATTTTTTTTMAMSLSNILGSETNKPQPQPVAKAPFMLQTSESPPAAAVNPRIQLTNMTAPENVPPLTSLLMTNAPVQPALAMEIEMKTNTTTTTNDHVVQQHGAPAASAVLPPPGFGPTPVAVPGTATTTDSAAFVDAGPPGLSATFSLPGFDSMSPSTAADGGGGPPPNTNISNNQGSSLLESLYLFGQGGGPSTTMQTANPFATYSLPPLVGDTMSFASTAYPSSTAAAAGSTTGYPHSSTGTAGGVGDLYASFLDQDSMQHDGASLLGSGLLSSLLSDDSPQKTKNPFAT